MESKKSINKQTDLLLLCFAKKKNVVSGKFLYAKTASGYRTIPPIYTPLSPSTAHTKHLAHPFQR